MSLLNSNLTNYIHFITFRNPNLQILILQRVTQIWLYELLTIFYTALLICSFISIPFASNPGQDLINLHRNKTSNLSSLIDFPGSNLFSTLT